MASGLWHQREWLKKLNATMIPCPSCGTSFCMTGNEYGEEYDQRRQVFSPMARCPVCRIVFTEGLDIQGSRWWTPLRELHRMTDRAEAKYEEAHPTIEPRADLMECVVIADLKLKHFADGEDVSGFRKRLADLTNSDVSLEDAMNVISALAKGEASRG